MGLVKAYCVLRFSFCTAQIFAGERLDVKTDVGAEGISGDHAVQEQLAGGSYERDKDGHRESQTGIESRPVNINAYIFLHKNKLKFFFFFIICVFYQFK